jgi:nucleoside-diphosphate-sugar epimerase
MNFLVTGGTGFVGYNIVESLLNKKYKIKVLVRKTSNIKKLKQKKVELVYGNLLKPETLLTATRNVDAIIHSAGPLSSFQITQQELRKIHVEGTLNLLKAAEKNNIKRFIHISSVVVVGPVRSISDETAVPKPITPYDKAKYDGEEIVKQFCREKKIDYTIIRPAGVYGPHEMKHIAKLFQLLQKQKFFIVGNGKNLVSFVYVENLTQGILLALFNKKAVNKTYIISDKRPYEMNEFIYTIAKQLKVKLPMHIPKPVAYWGAAILECISVMSKKEPLLNRERVSNLTSSFSFSIKKAQKELGYKPKIGLAEGISKTITWYRKNDIIK